MIDTLRGYFEKIIFNNGNVNNFIVVAEDKMELKTYN